MTILSTTKNNPKDLFWDELSQSKAVLVSCEGSGHLQSMAPKIDKDKKLIWFVSKSSSDLAKTCGRDKRAKLC